MSNGHASKGLSFPFRFNRRSGGPQLLSSALEMHQKVRESIFQILNTRIGERLMRPDFGSRLHELVFEPNDTVLHGLIRYYVIDAIKRWEKRVMVNDVTIDPGPDKTDKKTLLVNIVYQLVNGQSAGLLIYPLHRE